MKLRALEMVNVRRFAGQVARVGGIGDGVSVLAAPNETGKSTLFDGLRALMFERHTGRAQAVRGLQPHAGGGPGVAAEVEIDGARFRVEKRWLSRPMARVTDAGGRVIAQDDEAEGWIAERLGGRLDGPSGLLWVRQGMADLAHAGPAEARRDLLSSVAGEIEAMTGGRRMDAVRARAEAALAALATATGRPRAGGPWDAAQRAVAALEAEETELAARVARLAEALARRRQAERDLAGWTDPAAEAERRARLDRAEDAARQAEDHARRLTEAGTALRLAEAARDAARARRDRLRALAEEAELAQDALAKARAAAQAAAGQEAGRRAAAEQAAGALEAARAAAGALRKRLASAQRRAQVRAAAARVADLSDRLARAEAEGRRADTAQARRAALPVTAPLLQAARRAAAALEPLRAQAAAEAVTLRFDYSGAARATLDGVAIADALRLNGPADLDLPGLGRLRVDPGARADAALPDRLARAEAALEAALAACGAETLAEAEAELARAADLEQEVAAARAIVAALVPEGLAALRAELDAARALAGDEATDRDGAETDSVETLAPLRDAAEAALTRADAADRAAAAALAQAQAALAAARATETGAASRAEAAEAVRGPVEDHAAALAAAGPALAEADAAVQAAVADRDRLRLAAPDAATVAAALAQARGAVQAAETARRGIEADLAELRGVIGTLAEEGVEEALTEVRGRLEAARARATALGAEVAALARLRMALDAARGAARDAYFRPVLQELAPLLALLHPGAEVALNDDTLLPRGLVRSGVDEALAILSGGTREQLAVLTRLAFARLFAQRGQAVPVILDDALVQTDDERIEAMFTALHRAAADQQVIVLTCRQRAFAGLGGQPLRLELTSVQDPGAGAAP